MLDVDIVARLNALGNILEDLDPENEGVRTYAAVKVICAELRQFAQEQQRCFYDIDNALLGIEQNAAVLAGLMPSWDQKHREKQRAMYLSELGKLDGYHGFNVKRP